MFRIFQNRSKKQARKKAGFSLVETMMGSVVMTLVLAGSFSALSQGAQMAGQARSEQFVDQLIHNELQYLKTLNWSSFDRQNNRVYDAELSNIILREQTYSVADTESLFQGRSYFQGSIPVRDLSLNFNYRSDGSGDSERKTLTFTFTWKEIDGRDMSRTVEFVYCKNGVHDSFVPAL